MISLIVCIKRRSDLTVYEFLRHWEDVHAPILLGCTDFARHVRRYVQYPAVGANSPVAALFGVSSDYDGVAILDFDDEAAIARAFAEPAYLDVVRPDEFRFIDIENCLPFVVSGHVIKAA